MKSCYDCRHCEPCEDGKFGRRAGEHTCQFPLPEWASDCTNDASNLIEESFHDATMAEKCEHYDRKSTESPESGGGS